MPRQLGQELGGRDGCLVVHEQVKHDAWGDEQQRPEVLVIDSWAYHNICSTGFAAEFPWLPIRGGQCASGPQEAGAPDKLVHCGVVVVYVFVNRE